MKILILAGNAADYAVLASRIQRSTPSPLLILHAESLQSAGTYASTEFSMIFLDVDLPGSSASMHLWRLTQDFPGAAVVAVASLESCLQAANLVEQGAWGYLCTGKMDDEYLAGMVNECIRRESAEILLQRRWRAQRTMIRKTIEMHDRERSKLGTELHENINQILAGCRMRVNYAMQGSGESTAVLPVVYNHLGIALEEIMKLSRALVGPGLADMSLKEAIRQLISPMSKDDKLRFHIRIGPIDVGEEFKLMLYRIIQEQLQNIQHHSNAGFVFIRIDEQDGLVEAEISDDGIGFDPADVRDGTGFKNIRCRIESYAGKLSIDSAPGRGCKLLITVPVAQYQF